MEAIEHPSIVAALLNKVLGLFGIHAPDHLVFVGIITLIILAIGLAIRYAAPSERKREIVVESPFGKFNWSVLSLPFLWPLFKSAREKSEDLMRNGVKQWKKMDVEDYAKPIRKRWKAWTR